MQIWASIKTKRDDARFNRPGVFDKSGDALDN